MAEVKFILDGKEVSPPRNWQSFKILANWVNGSVQPQLASTDMQWELESAEYIQSWIAQGRIFEGIPLVIQVSDEGVETVFNGFVDTTDDFRVIRENRVEAKAYRPEDLQQVQTLLSSFSFAYLYEKKEITSKDYVKLPYMVFPDLNGWDSFTLLVVTVIVIKESVRNVYDSGQLIAQKVKTVTSTPTQKPAEIIMALAVILLHLAYIALVVVTIYSMLNKLKSSFMPQLRFTSGMTLRKMLEKSLDHIGLSLDTNIKELDNIIYLPSRNYLTAGVKDAFSIQRLKKQGIPQGEDYGYNAIEIFELVLSMFDAQVRVNKGVLSIYAEGDDYWRTSSAYKLPSVLREKFRYNTDEVKATTMYSFKTDQSEIFTLEDFHGTNFQVDVSQTPSISYPQNLLKGYDEKRWNIALGSRKAVFEDIEKAFNTLMFQWNIFLKATGLKKHIPSISENIGVLRVSTKYWAVPKLVYLKNGLIPKNHRDILSARAMYENFHKKNSFAHPYRGQRVYYENVTIPFRLADYLEISINPYFTTDDGYTGKFVKLEWNFNSNQALCDFYLERPYIKNIAETTFEP